MPVFDRSNTPPEATKELVDGINAIIVGFRAMKIDSIQMAGPKSGSWYRNLIQVYVQAHLRRVLTFIDAGHAELKAGRSLVTEMCSRSIYEGVACFCDFVNNLCPLLDANDVASVDEFIRTRTFATRVPEFLAEDNSLSATNIIAQMKKLAKAQPDTMSAYANLSDIVHPNALGTVIYFSALDDKGLIRFPEVTTSAERARDMFFTAAVMLLHFQLALETLAPRLEELSSSAGR